ncbi:unnamed protein product [Zymoseptoria tritici ST99CH_1A5]|uniref:MARVEL domain-containing protein n=1 Tax=Zymoseptoria tritici ST99CH_1A5 TaxID=1276529 RepID=A0A1Y6LQL4_ZYMTR|nr:unnamed protein product [Zymoseptoria tritici ST99CH_1A5]
MRLPQNKLQQIKAIIHGVQTLLVFIAGCLTLAVMAKSDGHGGETKYYFALCFFTLPAVAFQVVVPLWSRAWRFCNVYAFATIDLLFCILWFAAAIAVAVWNASEVTTTEKPKKEATPKRDDTKEANPTKVLACGSETICKVSKATVGFAVILFFLFAAASYLSICALIEYRKTGVKPNSTSNIQQSYSQRKNQLEKDAVWSSNTDDIRTSSDGPVNDDDGEHGKGLLRKSGDDGDYLPYPGRRTSYHSQMSVPPLYDPGVARN